MAVDLLKVLRESDQEVPEWLVCLARETNKNHAQLFKDNSCDHGEQQGGHN